MKPKFLSRLVAAAVFIGATSSLSASFNLYEKNLQVKFGAGYGYSYYGISRGSSFNVNPGTGLEFEAGALFNWRFIGVEGNFAFTTISDSHFEADGKVFRTVGSGSLIWLDPKVGWYKKMGGSGKWDYFFAYGGFRHWQASYSISRLGDSEFQQDGALSGTGFTVGGRYVTTFSMEYTWGFAFQVGAFLSFAPTGEYELDGEQIEIQDSAGLTPGLELGFGYVRPGDGFAAMIVGKYDVMISKFSHQPDPDSVEVSSSSGTGTTKVMLVLTKDLNIF